MISFMKYKWLYFLISGVVLVPGIFSLLIWGLKPSIDFTGGTLLELKFEKNYQLPMTNYQKIIQEKGFTSSVQSSGDRTILIRTKNLNQKQVSIVEKTIGDKVGEIPQQVRFETVGPVLGAEFLQKTLIAALLAILGILSYVAYVFKNLKFGISAVLALFHDLLMVIGIFSLLGHFRGVEVDTLFVTAVLTTMSFSVHDTIVVFDRIREKQKQNPTGNLEEIVNLAVSETIIRSLNNSLTIVFMLLVLLLLGGETTKWFIFALLIGTISGTYSSPFVATPILVIWQKIAEKRHDHLS